jgi:hypothetical protein
MSESIRDLAVDLTTFYNVNYRRWSLHDPNFVETDGSLTWRKRSGFLRIDDYDRFYQQVIDDVQYSLMIDSAAVVQLYYQADGKRLCEASLAFIPKPGSGREYFRLDFDARRARDYSHTVYHGHLGFNCKDMRFSVKEYPYPSQFLRFACALAFGQKIQSYNRDKFLGHDLGAWKSKYHHSLSFVF